MRRVIATFTIAAIVSVVLSGTAHATTNDRCHLTVLPVTYDDGTSAPVCAPADGVPMVFMRCTETGSLYPASFVVVFVYRARDLIGDQWNGRKFVVNVVGTRTNSPEHAMGAGVVEILEPDTIEYQGVSGYDATGYDPFRDYGYTYNQLPLNTAAQFDAIAAAQCAGTATLWTADSVDLEHS